MDAALLTEQSVGCGGPDRPAPALPCWHATLHCSACMNLLRCAAHRIFFSGGTAAGWAPGKRSLFSPWIHRARALFATAIIGWCFVSVQPASSLASDRRLDVSPLVPSLSIEGGPTRKRVKRRVPVFFL